MKISEQYARRAWCKLSLGNIATPTTGFKDSVARPANFEAVVKESEPFFAEAIREQARYADIREGALAKRGNDFADEVLRLNEELDATRAARTKAEDTVAELMKSIEYLNNQLQLALKPAIAVADFKQAVEATLFGGQMPKDFDAEWLQQLARRVKDELFKAVRKELEAEFGTRGDGVTGD